MKNNLPQMDRNSLCPHRLWLVALLIASLAPFTRGQEFFERMSDWPLQLKINGTVIAGSTPETAEEAKLMLPDSLGQQRVFVISDARRDDVAVELVMEALGSHKADVEFFPWADDGVGISADALAEASAVCILIKDDLDSKRREAWLAMRKPLVAVVRRGGTVMAMGEAAPLVGKHVIIGHDLPPRVARGWNLVPDGVFMLEYGKGDRQQRQLSSVLAAMPRAVGVGVTPHSAFVLSGRKCTVAGTGEIVFIVGANEREPMRLHRIRPASGHREPLESILLDWTQWRRMAIELTLPLFPPEDPPPPRVEKGTLVIVGGGGLPDGLMEDFVERAGGKEHARLVYVPCSESEELSPRQSTVEYWKRLGVQHATWIHTKDREKANGDEEFLRPLRDATGIWFGGGRQWNFADSYYGTTAHKLMKEVLRRGGVIGGSSAGASIQASYLARATPIENFRIMAPGYERGGLGFIRGVAIDQHFSQRRRQRDMTALVNRYPQLLGIGIDERTAIIVQGSIAEVTGAGRVFFYDRNQPVFPDRPDYVAIGAGQRYDLVNRKVLPARDKDDS